MDGLGTGYSGNRSSAPCLPLVLRATRSTSAEWIGTPLADFSFFCGLNVNNPASQSLARRSTMASRRAPVRVAIVDQVMHSEAGGASEQLADFLIP